MVGKPDALIQSGGIWKELVEDGRIREAIKPTKENILIRQMKELKMNMTSHFRFQDFQAKFVW